MPVSQAELDDFRHALARDIDGEIRDDSATRALYSTDASNYRHIPLAVVTPRSTEDVLATLAACAERGLPVLPRGAGTSVGGQATNAAVVLDFTRHLNQVLDIDPAARLAVVQPGVVLDALRARAGRHGLTFGPDPSTHSRCTLGGMIGNNACGSHSIAWGKTSENVRSLDVALSDGTMLTAATFSPDDLDVLCARGDRSGLLFRNLRELVDTHRAELRTAFPRVSRRVSGYHIDALLPERGFNLAKALVGSEGTCATLLGATVDLVDAPPAKALVVLGFPSNIAAADAVPELLDLPVLTMEGIDRELVRALAARRPGTPVSALPDGTAWLYLEVGGSRPAEAERLGRAVAARAAAVGATSLLLTDPAQQRELWAIREEGAGLATRLGNGNEAWSGWEDAAVPPEQLGSYLREFTKLLDAHGRRGVVYGHFGEGCLHVRIDFPLTATGGREQYRAFLTEAADLVVAHGGSLSGEHGDGQARSELLPKMYASGLLDAFQAFKTAFDPEGRLNPGRIVDPAPLDTDLRVVVAPPVIPTRARLALQADNGDLAAASRRCVGVGKCVADSGGVMCPSYRATHDEKHSTRGRARLLFELLAGEVVTEGWRSHELRDALDLCLGCKGCKSDCPVGVDMAAYKVEFLSRHYQGRLRPPSHYLMGSLPRWARLASAAPGLVNRVSASRLAGPLKALGGVAAERDLPTLATTTLQQWFEHRRRTPGGRTPVLLWPDTFTNYFEPKIGRDAIAVMERLGFDVILPPKPVCCGLTWFSTGQLRTARTVLRRTLETLAPFLAREIPIIGLEPSCTAMLRKDTFELLPEDRDARALATSVRTFAEHLDQVGPLPVRAVSGNVLTQVHCHQYADLGYQADRAVLGRVRAEGAVLDGSCCGLAGNFGFERGHYDISVACAEHELLPAIECVATETEIHADGFSCRTQIRQLSAREPVHLATLTARALGLTRT